MRKLLRLAFLAGLLLVAPVAPAVTPVYAFGSCENIIGNACSPDGRTLQCTWEGDFAGMCTCSGGQWDCI
ncbi:MAG TPA: hypothetical protein VHG32_06420 [Thermoanaerobaculia bacterium]|jgi:hypothetical protein|nr:hypothetical protein [Thermoanaerobaculia bacterium]